MKVDLSEGFPRLEFKRSMLPYRLVACAVSLVVPSMPMKAVNAIAPGFLSAHPTAVLVAWCLTAAGCLFVLTRLRSRMDFENPIVIVEPEGATISHFVTKTWLWASISKIKFYESGRFKENKSVVFHFVAGGSEVVHLRRVVGTTGRQLFDTMRAYHRKFGPPPDHVAGGLGYDSSSWTGLDDE